MKKITIFGNSSAGAKAIEEIRAADQHSEIILFPLEESLSYDRSLFVDYLAQKIEAKDVLSQPKSFYEQNNVQIISDKKIKRINFRRQQITTEEKETFPYDELIIANTPEVKFPEIKGTNKDGVFGLIRFDDVQRMGKLLNLVDTVVIESQDTAVTELAQAIHSRGVEVVVITANPTMTVEEGSDDSLRVINDSQIAEILGDSEAKAVRLSSGKVLSAEMVIFTDTMPNLRIFNDTPLQITKKITVDQNFKTNMDHVFAVDAVCEITQEGVPTDLSEQGRIVAAAVTGQAVQPEQASNV